MAVLGYIAVVKKVNPFSTRYNVALSFSRGSKL